MTISKNELIYEYPVQNGDEIFKELIIYIAERYETAAKFGAIKLNKCLFFSDFLSFLKTGTPVTGAVYMHLENGPVPKKLVPVRKEMIKNGDITLSEVPTPTNPQHRVIALRKSKIKELISTTQLSIVDEVIRYLWDENAKDTSLHSHGLAWSVFNENKELIPYQAALLNNEKITEKDITRTSELALIYAW